MRKLGVLVFVVLAVLLLGLQFYARAQRPIPPAYDESKSKRYIPTTINDEKLMPLFDFSKFTKKWKQSLATLPKCKDGTIVNFNELSNWLTPCNFDCSTDVINFCVDNDVNKNGIPDAKVLVYTFSTPSGPLTNAYIQYHYKGKVVPTVSDVSSLEKSNDFWDVYSYGYEVSNNAVPFNESGSCKMVGGELKGDCRVICDPDL